MPFADSMFKEKLDVIKSKDEKNNLLLKRIKTEKKLQLTKEVSKFRAFVKNFEHNFRDISKTFITLSLCLQILTKYLSFRNYSGLFDIKSKILKFFLTVY